VIDVHDLWSFALLAGLVTIVPGLDTALVLRTAARHSRRAAFGAALGVNTGVIAWGIAAAVGVSAVLSASETAYLLLRIAGALYLLKLGIGFLLNAFRGTSGEEGPAAAASGFARSFRQGLFTNLLNPKVGAFYVAGLPQFVPQSGDGAGFSATTVGIALALVHNLEGLLWFTAIILAVARLRPLLQRSAVQRGIDAVAGTAIIGFGARLALIRD